MATESELRRMRKLAVGSARIVSRAFLPRDLLSGFDLAYGRVEFFVVEPSDSLGTYNGIPLGKPGTVSFFPEGSARFDFYADVMRRNADLIEEISKPWGDGRSL